MQMKQDNTKQIQEDNEIIRRIKEDDPRALINVYKQYHNEFLRFAKKSFPHFHMEKADDIFSDSILALYRNIKTDRINSLTSTLKTYLFQIGKFRIIDELRKEGKTIPVDNYSYALEDNIEDINEKDKKLALLWETIEQLTEPCKSLLNLFWYKQKRDNEIAELMNYSSADSVKTQRFRCMKALRNTYLSLLVEEELITSTFMKRLTGA
jgi:RNA polymerase sigma factor (sigma-70 family)